MPGGPPPPAGALDLLDWRRRTAELYAAVRAEPDPARAHARWRAGRDALYSRHPETPLRAGDERRRQGLSYFAYDPALRFEPALEPPEKVIERRVAADGAPTTLLLVGHLFLPAPVGARVGLWRLCQYGDGLFLPLRDATAGTASYGGGRYLLDTAKGADLGGRGDRLVVDLNFLYHPSCGYDPRWQCPLAPLENTIAYPVRAGERL